MVSPILHVHHSKQICDDVLSRPFLALSSGLPTVQLLMAWSTQIWGVEWMIKNWTMGRPGNKASSFLWLYSLTLLISQLYTVQNQSLYIGTTCIQKRDSSAHTQHTTSLPPHTRVLKTVFRDTCRWSQRRNNSWHCCTVRERRYSLLALYLASFCMREGRENELESRLKFWLLSWFLNALQVERRFVPARIYILLCSWSQLFRELPSLVGASLYKPSRTR